ncbi:MAG: ExbD/TolR family protein [Bacteroidia bacterium]
MNFRQRKYVHAEVQAGALSDILFFLMLFFLIISTLASPNAIKLLLPKAQTGKSIPSQVINVSITNDLKYYINQNEVTMANMEQALMNEASKHENPSVVLRMDKAIAVEEMVKVIDVVNKAKVPVVIAIDKGKTN